MDSLMSLLNRQAARYREARDPQKAHKFKYVQWPRTVSGWGNRFSTYISAFVFGLITDRLVYIDSIDFDDLLNTTIPEFQSWSNQKRILQQTDRGRECLSSHFRTHQDNWPPLSLRTDWLNKDQRDIEECVYQVWTGDGDYLVPIFQRNKFYADMFQDLFPRKEVFFYIHKWLYQPRRVILDAMHDTFSLFKTYAYRIGVHIRTKKFTKMAKNFPYAEFCDLAKGLGYSSGFKKEQVMIYVSSDDPEIVYPIIEKCMSPFNVHHSSPSRGFTDVGNVGNDVSALADMYLFAHCDELIATIGSSFSEVAAGIGKITPYHVLPGTHVSITNPQSYKQINSEPCMYDTKKWLSVEGKEKTKSFYEDGLWQQYASCHPNNDAEDL